ncbi:unnamed protein product [Chironomus riparius]|uniref:Uncharacterized protein n=1 Tax=Chironomus riparius TaxID=315576 RepID=A0A9N9RID8_9DIPT|nr:unnamed protein product [Chironomus riparius]
MVHIAIENLLSSCTNRPLYEALWFLAFTKNSRPENLENESVSAICNELMARIKDEIIDARSFLISTNLAFGTVRLYKAQIDKLYDQAKFALQSCNTTFNHMDWFTQMTQITSTPIVQPKTPRTQKILIRTQTTIKKKSAKKSQPAPKLLDDFDLIESIYAIAEDDEEDVVMTPVVKSRKRGSNKHDTGIGMDPTMASDVHAITMREPMTLMTSGYNTMLTNEEEDGFGDKMGEEFQSFLKETDNTVLTQDELIQSTSNLLTTKSRKRTKNNEESYEIKKRRLTYMNYSESISVLRNANVDQQVPNINIYEQEVSNKIGEVSTFYESLSVSEANNRHSMQESSLHFEPMDIEEPSLTTFNDPTILNTTFNDQSTLRNTTDTLLENLTLNEPTILDNDETMIPDIPVNDVPMIEPETSLEESEFILDDVPKFIKQKRVRKSRSLITDKQIVLPIESVKKGIQNYKEKIIGIAPFADFQRRMHFYKSCTDVLFSTGSFRLKKSTLHDLYVRNMKKVPTKLLKQQIKENVSNSKDIKNLRRSSRSAKVIVNLKEHELNNIEEEPENILVAQVIDPKDVEMKEISPLIKNSSPELDNILNDIENISPDIIRKPKRLTRSATAKMILKELNNNNIDVEMQELELPEIQPYLGIEKVQPMDDFELPPALNYENIKVNNVHIKDVQAADSERIDRKKIVIKKLTEFWKQSDKLITMDKICDGMLRSEAAGTFFELLLLAKRCVVELVHKTDSLEISNILCKMSTSQLSKELYC